MRKLTRIIQEKAEGSSEVLGNEPRDSGMSEFQSCSFFDDCIPIDRKKKTGNSLSIYIKS